MKRLFYDIETSLGLYSSFGQGWNKTIGMKDEIVPCKIICICWKWEGEKEVHSVEWDEGDDYQLVKDFIEVLNQADEICGHNADKFDLPRIRARAIIHRLTMSYDYASADTLKLARARAGKGFKFESNKLDYIAQIFGFGNKIRTNLELWQRITFPAFIPSHYPRTEDYDDALDDMVKYCCEDVRLLEKVYLRFKPYVPMKIHMGVHMGGHKWDCAKCGSGNTKVNANRTTAAGAKKVQWWCNDCHTYSHTTAVAVRRAKQIWLLDRDKANDQL
tara:strand:- start:2949 stop:3770 length:822 start_codon:yes stop_codon:yes gene_type:complete